MKDKMEFFFLQIQDIFEKIYHIQGISGHETKIAKKISEILSKYGEISRGKFGSVICHIQNPKENNPPRIMVCAHMDTPGFMVKSLNPKGKIKFARLGLKDMRALHHQRVVVHSETKRINGVIISEKDENFFIDTGYSTEKLREMGVEIGDPITFLPAFVKLSQSKIMSTSVDNRLGLAMLIALAENLKKFSIKANVYLVASTREEWGGEGALMTAKRIKPDLGIIFDTTYVTDPIIDGKGPVLTLLDRSTILPRQLRNKLIVMAKELNINLQREVMESGGTDARSITSTGTPVICILPASRYSHSSIEIFDVKDAEDAIRLTEKIILEPQTLLS
jgi:endoglucanase